MKLFTVAILSLFSLLTARAHAQEAPKLPSEAPLVQEAPADNKEFTQDIDDFEKKMAKDVPGGKRSTSAPQPIPSKSRADNDTEKARNTMKQQLADSARAIESKKPVKKSAAKKSAKKPAKKPKKKVKPEGT